MDKEIQKLEEAFKAKVGAPQDDPSPKRRHPLNYPPPYKCRRPTYPIYINYLYKSKVHV